MADRGEVLRTKRRLGFLPQGEAESVIVVQANPLNDALPTVLVVPLDPAVDVYGKNPAVLRVPRAECGANADQVAVAWLLRAVRADSLALGPVGRLRPATLDALDRLLRLVLGLR